MPDALPSVSLGPDAPDPEFWGPPDHDRRPIGVPRPDHRGRPFERLVDRVRDWRTDPRLGVAVLVVVALVAGIVWYRIGAAAPAPSGDTSHRSTPAARSTGESTAATSSSVATGGERITVHVAGAVAKPGVYELKAGTRVVDAIESAGGGVPGADLDRLNLAAKLADGQRVVVQKVGDPAAAPAAGGGSPDAGTGTSGAPGASVNLNTATQAELEALPGIGPSLAQAILAERQRRGGFRSVNELREVRGIGDKRFADLKSKVTV